MASDEGDKVQKLQKLRAKSTMCQEHIYFSENYHPAIIMTKPAPHSELMSAVRDFFREYYSD